MFVRILFEAISAMWCNASLVEKSALNVLYQVKIVKARKCENVEKSPVFIGKLYFYYTFFDILLLLYFVDFLLFYRVKCTYFTDGPRSNLLIMQKC